MSDVWPQDPEGSTPSHPSRQNEASVASASVWGQGSVANESSKPRNKILTAIKYILALVALILGLRIVFTAFSSTSSSQGITVWDFLLLGCVFLIPAVWFFSCEIIDKIKLPKSHQRIKRFTWLPALASVAALVGVMFFPTATGIEESTASELPSFYNEKDYLNDTDVGVWSFDITGEERVNNGKQMCKDLNRNGWVSSDPEAVTLAFSFMSLSYVVETMLTDAPDLPEVEGLEKSRYLVKYATKVYCPELHRDEIPDLEDVLARQQENDEKVARMRDIRDLMNSPQ